MKIILSLLLPIVVFSCGISSQTSDQSSKIKQDDWEYVGNGTASTALEYGQMIGELYRAQQAIDELKDANLPELSTENLNAIYDNLEFSTYAIRFHPAYWRVGSTLLKVMSAQVSKEVSNENRRREVIKKRASAILLKYFGDGCGEPQECVFYLRELDDFRSVASESSVELIKTALVEIQKAPQSLAKYSAELMAEALLFETEFAQSLNFNQKNWVGKVPNMDGAKKKEFRERETRLIALYESSRLVREKPSLLIPIDVLADLDSKMRELYEGLAADTKKDMDMHITTVRGLSLYLDRLGMVDPSSWLAGLVSMVERKFIDSKIASVPLFTFLFIETKLPFRHVWYDVFATIAIAEMGSQLPKAADKNFARRKLTEEAQKQDDRYSQLAKNLNLPEILIKNERKIAVANPQFHSFAYQFYIFDKAFKNFQEEFKTYSKIMKKKYSFPHLVTAEEVETQTSRMNDRSVALLDIWLRNHCYNYRVERSVRNAAGIDKSVSFAMDVLKIGKMDLAEICDSEDPTKTEVEYGVSEYLARKVSAHQYRQELVFKSLENPLGGFLFAMGVIKIAHVGTQSVIKLGSNLSTRFAATRAGLFLSETSQAFSAKAYQTVLGLMGKSAPVVERPVGLTALGGNFFFTPGMQAQWLVSEMERAFEAWAKGRGIVVGSAEYLKMKDTATQVFMRSYLYPYVPEKFSPLKYLGTTLLSGTIFVGVSRAALTVLSGGEVPLYDDHQTLWNNYGQSILQASLIFGILPAIHYYPTKYVTNTEMFAKLTERQQQKLMAALGFSIDTVAFTSLPYVERAIAQANWKLNPPAETNDDNPFNVKSLQPPPIWQGKKDLAVNIGSASLFGGAFHLIPYVQNLPIGRVKADREGMKTLFEMLRKKPEVETDAEAEGAASDYKDAEEAVYTINP